MSAALGVVDNVGVEELTIRAVARAVGAPPMSLYSHFANKEELLDLMYTELSRRLYADHAEVAWEAELMALARQVRAILIEHPRWIPLLSRPAPPAGVPLRERLLAAMTSDGMSPERALSIVYAVIVAAIGNVLTEISFREPGGKSSLAGRFERVKEWLGSESSNAYPISRAAFTQTPRLDLAASLSDLVESFIAGVKRQKR